MTETIVIEMQSKIIGILTRNNFGVVDGHGRKLRLRDLTDDSVRIEGGALGATFSLVDGLMVWNLGVRNKMREIKVGSLHKIENELYEVFNGDSDD